MFIVPYVIKANTLAIISSSSSTKIYLQGHQALSTVSTCPSEQNQPPGQNEPHNDRHATVLSESVNSGDLKQGRLNSSQDSDETEIATAVQLGAAEVFRYPTEQNPQHTGSCPQPSWVATCAQLACGCKCHQRYNTNTPEILGYILGSAQAGWFGLHRFPCTERSCVRQQTKAAWMNIYFPPWLFRSMVSVNVSTSPLCGLRFGLKFPRLVDKEAKTFYYAKLGLVDCLIDLFQDGKASPGDVQYDTGFTALSVRESLAISGLEPHLLIVVVRNYAWSKGGHQTAPRRSCRSLRRG